MGLLCLLEVGYLLTCMSWAFSWNLLAKQAHGYQHVSAVRSFVRAGAISIGSCTLTHLTTVGVEGQVSCGSHHRKLFVDGSGIINATCGIQHFLSMRHGARLHEAFTVSARTHSGTIPRCTQLYFSLGVVTHYSVWQLLSLCLSSKLRHRQGQRDHHVDALKWLRPTHVTTL